MTLIVPSHYLSIIINCFLVLSVMKLQRNVNVEISIGVFMYSSSR